MHVVKTALQSIGDTDAFSLLTGKIINTNDVGS